MPNKIRIAIQKANLEVSVTERATDDEVDKIVKKIRAIKSSCVHIEVIQDMIETGLMKMKRFNLSKKYILYRYNHKLTRELTEAESSVIGILDGTNIGVIDENSNKNSYVNSTQRDLMAGEVSRTIAKKVLLPDDLREANENMELHWHDIDYSVQKMVNCFRRSTRFITSDGTHSFYHYKDGDVVYVPSHDGRLHHAVVHNHGVQPLYHLKFKDKVNALEKDVYCTKDHTWMLKDGSTTTEIKVGDVLYATPEIEGYLSKGEVASDIAKYWCIGVLLGYALKGDTYRVSDLPNNIKSMFILAGYDEDTVLDVEKELSDAIDDYSRSKNLAVFSGFTTVINLEDYLDNSGFYQVSVYNIPYHSKFVKSYLTHYLGIMGYFFLSSGTDYVRLFKASEGVEWTLVDINYECDEEVWCLEVDDTHTFILDGGMVTGNCCLINIKDMLDNGTVMNDYLITSPKSFRTACNILTQIVAIIASNQYGGQSVAIKHLGKYLAISRERFKIEAQERLDSVGIDYTEEQLNKMVEDQLRYELSQGVQTIQFQLNTLVTTNGI